MKKRPGMAHLKKTSQPGIIPTKGSLHSFTYVLQEIKICINEPIQIVSMLCKTRYLIISISMKAQMDC